VLLSLSRSALFIAAAIKFQQNRKKNSTTATTTVCQSQSAVLPAHSLCSLATAVLVNAYYRFGGLDLSVNRDMSFKLLDVDFLLLQNCDQF